MAKFKPAEPVAEPVTEPTIGFETEATPTPFVADMAPVEPVAEPPAPPAPAPAMFEESEMISVNRLGLYRVLCALIQDKDAYSGVGARRAVKEIFQVEEEALQARWEEIKSYFYGGPNYHKIG